jgi:hypothetical protein
MRRVIHGIVILVILFGSSVFGATAQDASPVASPVSEGPSLLAELGYPTLEVTTTDGVTLDVPAELEAGRYHIIFNNQSEMELDLEVYQLPEGFTNDDLIALFEEAFSGEGPPEIPDVFYDVVFNGGVSTLPGGTGEVVLDLTPGEWTFNLYNYDPETDENVNNSTAVTVTGEMPDVEAPADIVEIGMGEMYFEVSAEIVAGPQIWQLVSEGQQPHHLILSSVPEGTTVEQIMELAASFGPPASPEASPVAAASPAAPALSFDDTEDVFYSIPLSGGQTNFVVLDVEPGTYAMICFLPAPDGTPHVMLGMVEVVVVD